MGCQAEPSHGLHLPRSRAVQMSGWTERGRPVMWASCHRALTQCHRSPAGHTSCQPLGSQTSVPPACSSLEGGTVAGSALSSGQGRGPSPVPPAEVLTLGQAEDDGGVESVSRPQSVDHPGWWESIGVEQPSIRAQGIGALLSPGTDKGGPARPSIRLGACPPLAPSLIPLPQRRPRSPGTPTPHTQDLFLASPSSPFLHTTIQALQGLHC